MSFLLLFLFFSYADCNIVFQPTCEGQMHPVHVWTKRVGAGSASDWCGLLKALHERHDLVLSDGENIARVPGLLFVQKDSEAATLEILAHQGEQAGPILVIVNRRSDVGGQKAWNLMRTGAADLLVLEECEKPVQAIMARLARTAEIEEIVNAPVVRDNLIGESRCWRQLLRQAIEVARFSSASLLLTGESGTGKELIARLLHTLDTRPTKKELVILDCTTVSPELAGSEFFGHERGSFTNAIAARNGLFALAHEGTLFLDEVGELPVALQAELLRAIQERSYKRVGGNTWQQTDFRLVCATNRDLKAEEARGNFRSDFYHRIACARCHLPPLRERRADILPLARHFLQQVINDDQLDFDPVVKDFLLARDYPGNVRELRQLVQRMAVRHVGPGPVTLGAIPSEDRGIALQACMQDWRNTDFQNALRRALGGGLGLQTIREQTADAVIELALEGSEGNLHRAAVRLGVSDRALQMRRAAKLEANRGNGSGHATVQRDSQGATASPNGSAEERSALS
jgi:transcriptional regulator with GAF, ATPase, and Fis domain